MWGKERKTPHLQNGASFQRSDINTQRTCWLTSEGKSIVKWKGRCNNNLCLLWAGSSTNSVQRLRGVKERELIKLQYSSWETTTRKKQVRSVPSRPNALKAEVNMGKTKKIGKSISWEDLRGLQGCCWFFFFKSSHKDIFFISLRERKG